MMTRIPEQTVITFTGTHTRNKALGCAGPGRQRDKQLREGTGAELKCGTRIGVTAKGARQEQE